MNADESKTKLAQDLNFSDKKIAKLEILSLKNIKLRRLRDIWADIPYYERYIDEQVEINAHYSGYLSKQENDIKTFKKDESLVIPEDINYESFSGFSNEVNLNLN